MRKKDQNKMMEASEFINSYTAQRYHQDKGRNPFRAAYGLTEVPQLTRARGIKTHN